MSAPLVRIPVGVVVERAKAASQWIDFTWRPSAVLPGVPEAAPWTMLGPDGDRTAFYAGRSEIELFAAETAQYLGNLESGTPSLWVVLRPTGVEPPYDVVAVTADPTEGEGYISAGDNLVEPVPMPDGIRETIEAFVAEHHVAQTFFKRKRDRADPEALARRGPATRERGK